MALTFKLIGHTIPLQNIIKLYFQFKLPYAYNSNILDSRFSSCDSKKDGKSTSVKNPNIPTLYESRKISQNLPSNNVSPPFQVLNNMPTGVFRETQGEILGFGAAKCCSYYPNPEYFAYHNMSFFDFHLYLRQYRLPSPDSKRKPT